MKHLALGVTTTTVAIVFIVLLMVCGQHHINVHMHPETELAD